ncbi:MAG: hypothetical protein AB7G28_15220 [Pirellulales bacterium]
MIRRIFHKFNLVAVATVSLSLLANVSLATWGFFEGMDGAFSHEWNSSPGFPNVEGVTFGGPPSTEFETLGSDQILRMRTTQTALQRRGLVGSSLFDLNVGIVEARINTLSQASGPIDGLFDLWLMNADDRSKYVRVDLFNAFGTVHLVRWSSSIDGGGEIVPPWENNTYYRVQIIAGPNDNLEVRLKSDDLTTTLASHVFNHALSDLGTTFQIGFAQLMGVPQGAGINDVAVDYVAASLLGDYNVNGVVDAADYTVWRDNVGLEVLPNRNPEIQDEVGQEDFDFWKSHFTDSPGVAALVPEPATFLFAPMAGAWLLATRRR